MMAKGATYEEAVKLKELKQANHRQSDVIYSISNKDKNGKESDDVQIDEDDFIERYREERIKQLKSEKYGTVVPIQRTEWNHQVNDASKDGTWVIINLTAQKSSPNLHPMHKDICVLIENEIIPLVARKYPAVKFVSIPSTSAIENWPENNLPTLFCYRYGKLQHQLIGLGEFGVKNESDGVNCDKVEYRLGKLGIIDTDVVEDVDFDDTKQLNRSTIRSSTYTPTTSCSGEQGYGRSHFGGVMSQLQTSRMNYDENDDYDDVD